MLTRVFAILALIGLPAVAVAHPGPHTHPHAEHAHHPLLSLDHIIPLLGIVIALVVYRLYRSRSS